MSADRVANQLNDMQIDGGGQEIPAQQAVGPPPLDPPIQNRPVSILVRKRNTNRRHLAKSRADLRSRAANAQHARGEMDDSAVILMRRQSIIAKLGVGPNYKNLCIDANVTSFSNNPIAVRARLENGTDEEDAGLKKAIKHLARAMYNVSSCLISKSDFKD